MMKSRPVRFALVCFGLCFFFNPYFAAIDFLPDFIGCLLIALGLVPVARLYAPMREAQRAFLRLALIDAVKDAMLIFVFGGSALGEQELLILIVTFLSATLGTLFAVIAVRALFDGFDRLASTYDCEALYAVRRNGRSRTELLLRFSVFFIVFKEAILLLPEFAALLNSTYVDSALVRIYDYIGVMRVLAVIPTLIVGICWLISVIAYFVRLHRETAFLLKVGEQYAAFMQVHPGIRIKARYLIALCLIGAGVFLLTDFYLDYRNILSDTLGGALVLLGILLLGLPIRKKLPAALLAALYTAAATVSGARSYSFMSQHVGGDITRSEAVAAEYQAMWLWALAEFIVFLALLILLLLALRTALIMWGGYRPEYVDAAFEERHSKKIREEFDWQLIKCFIFGFASALLSFFFDYFKTWPDTEALRYFSRMMEALWIPDFLLALFFAVYMGYTLTLVFGKIKERFQFE